MTTTIELTIKIIKMKKKIEDDRNQKRADDKIQK